MVLSLLAYFFSMITALTALASLWIALVGGSAFPTVHVLQPYPRPVIAETAPVTPPKSKVNTPPHVAAARDQSQTPCEGARPGLVGAPAAGARQFRCTRLCGGAGCGIFAGILFARRGARLSGLRRTARHGLINSAVVAHTRM